MRIKRLLTPIFSLSCPFLIAVALHRGWLPVAARYYPVVVNFAFATVFAVSLLGKKAIITRIAEGMGETLDVHGIRYTRQVTLAWVIFNCINGTIAWLTVFAPLWIWTLYNGVIAYCLMGAMFAGEWFCRRKVKHAHQTL